MINAPILFFTIGPPPVNIIIPVDLLEYLIRFVKCYSCYTPQIGHRTITSAL